MKVIVSSVLAAACVASWASYELALIPTAGALPAISRYDPVNGSRMGEFATGIGSKFVDYHSPSSRTFVHSPNGSLYTYNQSTGQRMATTAISANLVTMMADTSGTYVWSSDGANVLTRTNIATGASLAPTLPGGMQFIRTVVRIGNNRMLAIAKSAGTPGVAMTFGGTASVLSGEVTNSTLFANLRDANSIGQAVYLPFTNKVYVPYFDNTNSMKLTTLTLSAAGLITAVQNGNFNGAGFTTTTALSAIPTHVGFRVLGASSADPTQVYMKEYTATGILDSVRTTNMLMPSGPFQASMIVAPEPTGVLALALGAFVLLRRRSQ